LICVVDASVAVKWFVEGDWAESEDHVDHALELLLAIRNGAVELWQPPHFLAEVMAVLARKKAAAAAQDLADLLNLDMRYVESSGIYNTALDLAICCQHHLFDTLYHAVALHTPGALLVTADRRYYDKARSYGQITWLTDLQVG
jgi:predicted nucleic acid-binding protein